MKNVLQEALELVGGDRANDYGPISELAERWSKIAQAVTGLPIRPDHLPLLMIGVKLARQAHSHQRDNLVDIAGYAHLAEVMYDEAWARAARRVVFPREEK